ncbi:methyl-accepting chemotaxis sensory transducer with TarH sensor [Paraburkholderia steynii]|uniref:Methyl-accepting chemotaxis sensory transducer with TarH sensor n=1 Tax=Paraburkholderia steynii TaxID=1245441 RepID=A0A7Z7BBG3_9BURK|nr:methyl-accepting chemotaxis protein [Paraburkholderia steynii]SDI56946.1 methyl-accepting chemotaxis sensory transducer with TarH sensor [Paraburkholderia steynii]
MVSFVQTIRFKIILAFSACVILMAAIGGYGISGLSRLNSNVADEYAGNTIPIIDLSDLREGTLDIRLQLRRIQVFHDQGKTAAALEIIKGDQERIDKAWNHYYPGGITSEKEREIADKIRNALSQFKAAREEALGVLAAGDYEKAAPLLDKTGNSGDTLRALLNEDAAINLAQAQQFVGDSGSTFRTTLWSAIALLGAGIIVAVGMSVYLLRTISNPLNKAVAVANHIARGKLENHVVVDAAGEFGQLLEALKEMDQQLGDTVRGIKTSTDSVAVASREIASGNTDLSARTEEQAASLEETAASMTQLTETVKQNADNARQANALATSATDMADAGNESVQAMVGTIGQISSSSSKISEITGVIEGIAFQTNILALNAAVEAARAGEQGRGFAVVASEVRSLAQRSATAAKEIKELISSSVATIQHGANQAAEVSATMGKVKQAIKHVSDIVGEIAAASEEQSRGIEQVNQAVGQMDEVTQQNAALVEQAAAAAQSLEEQATILKNTVSVFRIADTAQSISRVAIPQNKPGLPASRTSIRHSVASTKPKVSVAIADNPNALAVDAAKADWETF